MMLAFSQFDRRGYPTVSVRDGYREWLATYETTVEDEMNLVVLETLESIMAAGMPTHFDRRPAEPVAIETYVHLLSDHVVAARAVGFSLIEMRERLVDDRWIALKPRWAQYRNQPVSFAMAWRGRSRVADSEDSA
jgi:hypothetical protein